MKICGVIAEYNPFHNGHAYHLAQTRAILGADTAIVCMMSGNFVQRGALALTEKYRRAEAAVRCGADLVFELPLTAALSSAEGFARGAVSALCAFGSVGYLSFGSECGSVRALRRCAALADGGAVRAAFRRAMREGLSYAAARERSVAAVNPEAAALLSSPNNVLGLEYCRALEALGSTITPLTFRRRGASHDAPGAAQGIASASCLRSLVRAGRLEDCAPLMPEASYRMLAEDVRADAAAAIDERLDAAALAYLRRMDAERLARYEQDTEGLPRRLQHAIRVGVTFEEVCSFAQTRRYPLSRIRRALLRAFLDLPYASLREPIGYLRVLALSVRGRTLLRNCRNTVPVITKPLHEKRLPESLQTALRRDALADDLYALALPSSRFHAGGVHFQKSPFCARE